MTAKGRVAGSIDEGSNVRRASERVTVLCANEGHSLIGAGEARIRRMLDERAALVLLFPAGKGKWTR